MKKTKYLVAICFIGVYATDTFGDPVEFHGKQTPSKLQIIAHAPFKILEVC